MASEAVTRRAIFARLLRDRDGFVIVMVALLLIVLIGFAGLAAETGLWYVIKRQNQSAADAAALAAAFEYAGAIETGGTTGPTAAATAAANANEFDTNAPNTITVQNPPTCTAGKCTVQVSLTNQINTTLVRTVLPSTVTIATTATGGYQSLINSSGNPVGQTCLIGLGTYGSSPPSGEILRINGHGDFQMPNCILGSVSTDSGSIRCDGCSNAGGNNCTSGSWCIGGFATAGGMRINGQTPPVPIFTQFPVRNPYASVTRSPLTGSIPSGPCISGTWNLSTHAVDPTKLYCSLTISGTAIVTFPSNEVVYIDGGDFSITGTSASVTGTGVTIVLTQVASPTPGKINIDPSCGATISLTAPGPGVGLLQPSATASQGLLIFQDPTVAPASSSNTMTTGKASSSCASATVTLAGAIVTPRSNDDLKGNRVLAVKGCTEFIAQKFTFSGTPGLDDAGCNPPSGSGGGTQGGDGSTGVTINQVIVQQIFLTQ